MYKYDLHVHSSDSDGKYSKVDLLEKARENNIEVIAFCDHNSCENMNPRIIKQEYLEKYGMNSETLIIPAIEISAGSDTYRGIHILGYGIKDIGLIKSKIHEIDRQNEEMLFLQIDLIREKYGIPITVEQVKELSKSEHITSKDIESTLLSLGYISKKSDMYKYTNKDSLSHIQKVKISDTEAIKIINEAGGIAVLAHPIEIKEKNSGNKLGYGEDYINYLKYLKSAGLSGVETHTVKHPEYEQAMYYKGAKGLNLLTTAGSDFHDEERTPVFGVDYEPTEFLKPILECLKEREKNKYEEYSRD